MTCCSSPRLDNAGKGWQYSVVADERFERLRSIIQEFESCVIAYSGGVDSVFLAKVSHDMLGDRSLAVIADSPSLPRREFEEALALGEQFDFPVRVVATKEFDNEDYLANPTNRCFHCKHELFSELKPIAVREGFSVIAYGENASDVGDYRPGAVAAAEFQVRAPLKEAGLTKADIRELSQALGLPTADKPQMACLSSRIPYGEKVSPRKLSMIERAEGVLRDLGFLTVRVRHHELGTSQQQASESSGLVMQMDLARIELGSEEIEKIVLENLMEKIANELRSIGYHHVTLDLEGYRRGSLNASVVVNEAATE